MNVSKIEDFISTGSAVQRESLSAVAVVGSGLVMLILCTAARSITLWYSDVAYHEHQASTVPCFAHQELLSNRETVLSFP